MIEGSDNNYDLSFNSIKVRLRQKRIGRVLAQLMFQFHKGSIKTSSANHILSHCCCFNSIKVRLRPEGDRSKTVFTMFQFHKGSIKTQ